MPKRLPIAFCLAAGLFVATTPSATSASEPAKSYDIVIYGSTSAGVTAAVQGAKMGKSVVIVGPAKHIGGLTSSGLGRTDSGRQSAIGGLSREFYHRIWEYYKDPEAWDWQTREQYLDTSAGARAIDENTKTMWCFEPHVAEAIYEGFVAQYDIPVFQDEWLNRKSDSGVRLEDGRITSITMRSGKTFRGKMFIDATYEGDLMAAAGVSFTTGRESNEKYGEFLNGVQKTNYTHGHLFLKEISPYVDPDDPASGLVWGIHGGGPGEIGEGDDRIQAYCFRMCFSSDPKNQVPFPKPEGYDEEMYELLLRNFEAGDLRFPLSIGMMPNHKTDTNNNGPFSTDGIGLNYEYPEASYEERAKIVALHELYQKGLMWTLANHPRVPQSIRERVSKWGLAKNEFQENSHWPYKIYVREARRMIGEYVQTELDCRRMRICSDSVGLGSYNMDSHNCQRFVTDEGYVQNGGDVQVNPGGTYAISYRALTPKEEDVENLLVPVCLSASHIAYGSIRMEPVFMILGQSAATGAALAIDLDVSVQDVPYPQLKKRLLADGQFLKPTGGPHPASKLEIESLSGIGIDDKQAEREGAWTRSTSLGAWFGNCYLHDGDTNKGEKSVRFTTELEPGTYEVRMSYPPSSNRATNVPVRIHHADGTAKVIVNERKTPPIDGLFISLGTYTFGDEGTVEIRNDGTDGYVIVDAVQFIPQD